MRLLEREETPIIIYSIEKTHDPPDSTFEIAVPSIQDDCIINAIVNDLEITDDQR